MRFSSAYGNKPRTWTFGFGRSSTMVCQMIVKSDAEILMNQDVSHAGDIHPRSLAGQAFRVCRQMPNSLADDFEIAHDSIDGFLIRLELFECEAFDVLLDSRDRVEDIRDAQPPLSSSPPRCAGPTKS
jgi:hypothetical protein